MRNKTTKEPRFAKWMLSLLSKYEEEFVFCGDLGEEFKEIADERGSFKAHLWYWAQVLYAIPSYCKHRVEWSVVMFKHYMKIVIRSIKKHKGFYFINMAGLAVGLTCFILISLWVHFEINFDRFHENSDDLYQVITEQSLPNGDVRFFSNTPGALAHTLEMERPEILHVTRLVDRTEILLGTTETRFLEFVRFVDPAFLEMFSVDFIQGDEKTALSQPNSIVLTESIARKHFAEENPIGKEMLLGSNISLMVTGVIEELPENSFLRSLCLIPIVVLNDLGWRIDAWGGGNYEVYVHLEEEVELAFFKTQIRDTYQKHAPSWGKAKLTVRPITSIHLYDLSGGGPIVYVYLFSGLSIFMLLLAVANFINLSSARSVLRAKEIGVRKMIGAFRGQLTKQILMESVALTLFAGCIAVAIAYFLLPFLNQVTGVQIAFSFNGPTALFLLGIVILTGIISGIYPAFVLSSLRPIRAVKGGIRPGKNSLRIRKVLIAFQFSLSIFMMIAMIVVNKQLTYLNTRDLGYNRENVISMGLTREISMQYPMVRTELLRNPGILSMTRSSSKMDEVYTTTGGDAVTWEGQSSGIEMHRTHLMRVDPEFIETFQIDMVDGRFFSNAFPRDLTESVVINETALKTMDLKSPIGKRITVWNRDFRIIGVVKDFHFYSLHDEIQPLIFIHRYADFRNIFIRIHSQNLPESVRFIQNKLKEIAPGYMPDIKFLDENLHDIYLAEHRMKKLTTFFSFLAIFISCIGLLGLVSFASRQRSKEIAIRKVLGASEGNIVFQLFKETVICVVAANMIVWPVAYFALHGWLQNYAYHTTLGIDIFIFASMLVLVFAFLSGGWHVLKASMANPVDSLRYE